MTTYRLFEGETGPATTTADTDNYTMGLVFDVTSPAQADAVLMWRPPTSPGGPVTAAIYEVITGSTGTLLGTGSATAPADYNGYYRVALDTPVPLQVGKVYIACWAFTTDNFYSTVGGYWLGGAGDAGRVNGILRAPGQTGAPNAQNAFVVSGALAFPSSGFNGGNYGFDVEISDGEEPPENVAPTANAGSDQAVATGSLVTLSGSTSTDSDGTISSYAWAQTSGPSVTLSGSGAGRTFTPATDGTYVFTLTVTDNDGATDDDSVTVVATTGGGDPDPDPDPEPVEGEVLWVKTDEGEWVAIDSGSGVPAGDAAHVFRPETYGAVGDGVTDDTAAIQACIDAAVAAAPDHNNSVEVRFSAKEYRVNGPVIEDDFAYAQLRLPFISASEGSPKITLAIRGPVPAQPLMYWDQEQPTSAGAVLKSTLTTPPAEGGGAVLGGTVFSTGFPVPDDITTFSHMFVVIENLQVQLPHNSKFGGINLKRVAQAKIDGVAVHSNRYRNSVPAIIANLTETDNYGLWMPEAGNNAWNEIGSFSSMGTYAGLIAQEHLSAKSLAFIYCRRGLEMRGSGTGQLWPDGEQKQVVHATSIGMLLNEAVDYWVWNTSAPSQLIISEFGGEGVTLFEEHIHDPNDMLTGEVHFHDIYNHDPVVNGGARLRVINDNRNRGIVTAPALPATTVELLNPFWRDATVYLIGGTVVGVSVDGVSVGPQTMVRVPSGNTIAVTYSSAPTWQWALD